MSYLEEEPVSATEVSLRARRRRKDTSEDENNFDIKEDRPIEHKTSQDDMSRRDKNDTQLKRRNTGKKIDIDKARLSASRMDKSVVKQDKKSDYWRRDLDKSGAGSNKSDAEEHFKSTILDQSDKEEAETDDKNVTFCMWGHENCRTRSHYRYNWQWDYVQKYVEQHNKNMIQGSLPKETQKPVEDAAPEVKDGVKKPSKDGIKIRMQMLQSRQGKTSSSVKQKMFERDLELDMLRRKKNYQF